jgi:metallo-beta-lactamase class B
MTPAIRSLVILVLAGCGQGAGGSPAAVAAPPPTAPAPAPPPAPVAEATAPPPEPTPAPAAPASAASPSLLATLHGAWSEPAEPFRVVGNIYYVGAKNIASYLITTPKGHILLDTGTREMEPLVRASIAKLGFKLTDIKIMLSGHAHFDHVQGHAAMQHATGAKVMALGDDALALESGSDRSPLGAEGWDPVHVDRVLKDGDTVALGGTTMKAVWAPGHTPGCTVWTTTAKDKARSYAVLFYACAGPNAGVQVVGNPKFPTLAEDAMASFHRLKLQKPDIFLLMHPADLFKDKVDRIKAGETPHPLYNPTGWTTLMEQAEIDLQKRIDAERGKPPAAP